MKYIINGRALPERCNISFDTVTYNLDEEVVSVTCFNSQIVASLETSVVSVSYAKNRISIVSKMIVGCMGFALGRHYSLDLCTVVIENDAGVILNSYVYEGVGEGQVQSNPDDIFTKARLLAEKDQNFRIALNDYMSAIEDGSNCAFYCYRAIEAIKQTFAGKSDKQKWQGMHESLGTCREYITKNIKQHADIERHGNWMDQTDLSLNNLTEMQKVTQDILLAYLSYKSRACRSIPQ